MSTVKFAVPDKEQSALLRQLDIDPGQYAVEVTSEYSIHLQHHKTRNEVSIYTQKNSEGDPLKEEHISLLQSMGIDPCVYTITLPGRYLLQFSHNSGRYVLSIYPNRRVTNDNQREGSN